MYGDDSTLTHLYIYTCLFITPLTLEVMSEYADSLLWYLIVWYGMVWYGTRKVVQYYMVWIRIL